MEKAIQDAVFQVLLSSEIPQILGDQKIFYRGAIRDTPLPYLCFNIRMRPVAGEQNFLMEGELIFDIWDYSTVNDRTIRVMNIVRDIFNDAHLEADGVMGLRFYYNGSQEAPVENNRSNRRSEDEHFFRRELSFDFRGFDVEAHQNQAAISINSAFFDPNYEKYFSRVVAPTSQPDGIAYTFQLPTAALQIIYYTLDGVRYEDHSREGTDIIVLPTVPSAGTSLTVGYVPA